MKKMSSILFREATETAQYDVSQIFDNTDPAYLRKTLATRNPGGAIQAGSKFLETMTIEDLRSAQWSPLNHPATKAPAIAFTAKIPGKLGIVEIDKLDDSLPVRFQLSHGGSGGKSGKSAEVVSAFPHDMLLVDNTTLIAGPGGKGFVVWTFHPGDPSPAFDEITLDSIKEVHPTLTATVADAKSLGFRFIKKVDNLTMNEFYKRWQVLAGILGG